MLKFTGLAIVILAVSSLGSGPRGSAAWAGETLQDLLAVQIRSQGFACDKPLRAVRDAKRSRPDRGVWVLRCSNATYRVSRSPDLPAKVEVVQ
jgi:hypothetical protein